MGGVYGWREVGIGKEIQQSGLSKNVAMHWCEWRMIVNERV